MQRNSIIFWIIVVINNLVTVAQAQTNIGLPNPSTIDYTNIFNTQYTYIGIPVRDSVYIYAPPSSKSPVHWSPVGSIAIPKGTIAMDGNIGKNIFMTKEMIIFEEYGRHDTLRFHDDLPPIDSRVWIRTPHSTETDSYFLSGEKNVCYYREYDESEKSFKWHITDQLSPYMFKENRTQPVLTDKDGFYKLYSFIPDGGSEYLAALFKYRISFFRYPMTQDTLLKDKIIEPSKLNFPLPQGTITAFIYDYKYVAVVLQGQIDFYGFDTKQKKWIKADRIPPFRFADVYNNKK